MRSILSRHIRVAVGAGLLVFIALIATLVIRSRTAFSHFVRLQYCSLCGLQQSYHEICIFDLRMIRSTTQAETGISRILRTGERRNCGHCFNSAQEQMIHLSFRTPFLTKWVRGKDYGQDLFANRKYLAILQSVNASNPEISQLLWSRTLVQSLKGTTGPLQEIRPVLTAGTAADLRAFLKTNRYFRPARPNPERFFSRSF